MQQRITFFLELLDIINKEEQKRVLEMKAKDFAIDLMIKTGRKKYQE